MKNQNEKLDWDALCCFFITSAHVVGNYHEYSKKKVKKLYKRAH